MCIFLFVLYSLLVSDSFCSYYYLIVSVVCDLSLLLLFVFFNDFWREVFVVLFVWVIII